MEFRGNTGYINIDSDVITSGVQTGSFKKMLIWHNLWNLTREPILLSDGTKNEFFITYSSPIIPTQILLIGFFQNVLEWTDSAEKPFSKDYSMTFTVTNTQPSLDELYKDIQQIALYVPEATT